MVLWNMGMVIGVDGHQLVLFIILNNHKHISRHYLQQSGLATSRCITLLDEDILLFLILFQFFELTNGM